MNRKIILLFVVVAFFINYVSAMSITLTPDPTSLTLNLGETSQFVISYSMDNTGGLAGQKGVNLLGSPKLISYSGSPIVYSENATTTGSITINVNANVSGDFINYVSIGDQTINMPIHVQAPQQSQSCEISIFPLSLTNVKVSQGDSKARTVMLTVPQCFSSSITVSGVSLQTDEQPIKLSELSLGIVHPGSSINIPIEINAVDVSTGSYSDILSFLLYNSSGNRVNVPNVNIGVFVSSGISPLSNNSFSSPPSCVLSSGNLNLNTTATLTCSGITNVIHVTPQYNEFFEGISDDSSSGLYHYTFKPLKMGVTNFIALFTTYQGSPVFSPFIQEVRIASSGSSLGGTNLSLTFTPPLNTLSDGQTTIVQLIDTSTRSLVTSPEIYVDAVKLTSMNSSVNSFPITMKVGKNYEVRGKSPMYNDLVQIVNITSKPIQVTIDPVKEVYTVGEVLNLTSNVEGTAYKLNNVIITSPYTLTSAGNLSLVAEKQDYLPFEKTILIQEGIFITGMTPSKDEWRKGDNVVGELSTNASWTVELSKADGTISPVSQGAGNVINFKVGDYGTYTIKAGESTFYYVFSKGDSVWYNPFSWKWVKDLGWWWAGIAGIIILVLFILFSNKGGGKEGGDSGFELHN